MIKKKWLLVKRNKKSKNGIVFAGNRYGIVFLFWLQNTTNKHRFKVLKFLRQKMSGIFYSKHYLDVIIRRERRIQANKEKTLRLENFLRICYGTLAILKLSHSRNNTKRIYSIRQTAGSIHKRDTFEAHLLR